MKQILVVEDDFLLNNTLSYNLTYDGFLVSSAYTMNEAQKQLGINSFDLIILDINLPDGNGFDLCKQIKKKRDIPIIFLTANDMESDMVKGFELGADDYVTKPFLINIFQKKITALLRRIEKHSKSLLYNDGHLSINFSDLSAKLDTHTLFFSPLEYRTLKIFINNANHILTRATLLEHLWDIDRNIVDEHTLTSMVSRIRSKLGVSNREYIKTVYGMGYMWVGEKNGI